MDERDELIENLQQELSQQQGKNIELNNALASNSSYQGQEGNLIQYQLDSGEMLEKIEHFLRGDKLMINPDTQEESWIMQEDPELKVLNEYGVNSLMIIIGGYIDKGTFLSYYTVQRINQILADLGDELADFIYCNYEKMGMDTEFKKTKFKLIVLQIIHTIESAYRRAIEGKTSEDINTSKIYTQSELTGNRYNSQAKKRYIGGSFNPMNWGG